MSFEAARVLGVAGIGLALARGMLSPLDADRILKRVASYQARP